MKVSRVCENGTGNTSNYKPVAPCVLLLLLLVPNIPFIEQKNKTTSMCTWRNMGDMGAHNTTTRVALVSMAVRSNA